MSGRTQTRPKPAGPVAHRLTAQGAAEGRCTVGLLTWNAGEDGARCVASLTAQTEPDLQLLWIDNGSADGTAARILDRFPDLPPPFANEENEGFCVPHNRMIERCETKYYLALNQDVALAPDYIERLCDWLDEEGGIAMASGVMLRPPADPARPAPGDIIESAGLVFPRARYHFHLGSGLPLAGEYLERRIVPGVEGAAMLLRVAACRRASVGQEVFPASFFAYYEEIDLAHRLAAFGWTCGADGGARAVHAGKGSGGFALSPIRARFLANHWLVALRNDPAGAIVRELPYWLRGELQFWLPEYLAAPVAFVKAIGIAAREGLAARRFRREFARLRPPAGGAAGYRAASRELLCAEKRSRARR